MSAEARGVGPGEATVGANLGGRNKYSSKIIEIQSGEGFRVISADSRVSQS